MARWLSTRPTSGLSLVCNRHNAPKMLLVICRYLGSANVGNWCDETDWEVAPGADVPVTGGETQLTTFS